MKNIHMLQTKEPTRIFETNTGLQFSIIDKVRVGEYKGFHIYIISHEEIKDVRPHEGKWQLEKGYILNIFPNYLTDLSECKLVIMTTDPTLIADGVQAISDEFVEWFVKNPTCEFVEVNTYTNKIGVEYDANGYREMDVFGKEYRIKIPQAEPKQDLLPDFKLSKDIFDNLSNLSSKELSQEFSKLVDENFDELIDDESKQDLNKEWKELEDAKLCEPLKSFDNESKQETLDEAVKSYSEKEYSTPKPLAICIDFAKFGANWKAQRMYSEDEVDELVNNLISKFLNYNGSSIDSEKLKWFYQQIKKK